MVGATVGAVDHRVRFAGQLVMQPGGDEAPDELPTCCIAQVGSLGPKNDGPGAHGCVAHGAVIRNPLQERKCVK
jgi:hypothetical protein